MPGSKRLMMGAAGVAKGAITTPPGKLFTWGLNSGSAAKPGGQLALGDVIDRSSPVQVGALETYQRISRTNYSNTTSHFITSTGTLWGVGSQGSTGYIGVGTKYTDYSSPVQVGSLTTWANITSGKTTLAVKTDGTLWAWGENNKGQLGIGTINNPDGYTGSSSPVQVGSLTTWAQGAGKITTTNSSSSAAIKTDGTLWTWGRGINYGQLGHSNAVNYSSPVQVGSLTDWDTISGGNSWFHAKKTDGTLWAFGSNAAGYLGTSTTVVKSSPVQIGSLTTWTFISSGDGGGGCFAIKTDGTLWAWAGNGNGQLGTGNTTGYSSPVQVGTLTDWSRISSGQVATGAVKTDGTLWTWGSGSKGVTGHGNETTYSSPVQVGADTDWSRIATGEKYMWTIKEGTGE